MRVSKAAVSIATFGLVLAGTTALGGTALAGTPTAPAAHITLAATATCVNGTTQKGSNASTLQTCKNGVWVSSKCPAGQYVSLNNNAKYACTSPPTPTLHVPVRK